MIRALAHGGSDNAKTREMGDFMYGRSVSDPDGSVLEIMWMDLDRAMKAWGMAARGLSRRSPSTEWSMAMTFATLDMAPRLVTARR